MQTHEAELIARSLRHDAAAYGELVERYKRALYHHCYAIVRDESTAEDVAQQTFITAYYKLSTFDTTRRFSTWLFKIATHIALRELSRHKHIIDADDELLEQFHSPHPGPAVVAEYAELHHAIDHLKPTYRAVISLYYWQGCSYEEIAIIMGKPVGSIKGWMSRAKSILRKELT